MKNMFLKLSAAVLAVLSVTLIGCVTSKVSTVTPTATGFVTNTVTVVNTNNLTLDAAALQAATAVSVSLVVNNPKNAAMIPALKDAQIALDGILNGSNATTTTQVLTLLQANSNPALSQEITSLLSVVSAFEQSVLAKYGPSVAGQIGLAVTRAIDAGLIVGLTGH